MIAGVPLKGEPLVYLPVKVSPLGAKLVMAVIPITPRYRPCSRLLFTGVPHGSLRLSYLVGSTA